MIIGIGIDAVDTARFADWYMLSEKKLLRIFSKQEIAYCLSNVLLSSQRFAVRFAAREAFFKAMSQANTSHNIPFLRVCSLISIQKKDNVPSLLIDPFLMNALPKNTHTLLSLTHTQKTASAFVVLSADFDLN